MLMHLYRPKTLLTLRHANNLCRSRYTNLKIIKNSSRTIQFITSYPLHCSSFHAMEQHTTDLGDVHVHVKAESSSYFLPPQMKSSHDSADVKGGGASAPDIKQEILSPQMSHDSDEQSCDPTSMSHDEPNLGDVKVGGACASDIKQETDVTSLPAKYSTDERYGYLQKGFSTEMYKIEINNIPPKIGYKVRGSIFVFIT